ncbi:MAG: ABC transporter substrate-binding protein [Desulfomonile tiedjei]|nr:ABC transporter substrate-binding protein [Desulfomonile tiedjei]
MKNLCIVVSLVLLSCMAATFCAAETVTKVSLVPQWMPQAQFAGYMVALEKGFYREAGLDLTLIRGGPDSLPFEMLSSGRATFCTAWLSTGIQQRSAGNRVINLGQIVQQSALMLIAKKNSGITSPADLHGKRVGLWEGDFRIQPRAFFRQNNLMVEMVPLYCTANLFLRSGVDAISAMWYNEYHALLNCGLNPDELTAFFLKDFGLNFPEDGIYCLEETFLANPEVCARVVDASLRGWLYAFKHPEEALDVVMRYAEEAHTGTNRAHQRWMLARMKDLILPDGNGSGLGKLKIEDYSRVAGILLDFNLINDIPPFAEFYRGPK